MHENIKKEVLYEILKKIYNSSKDDLSYARTIYNELCILYNTPIIKHYIENKYAYVKKNNKYLIKYGTFFLIEINPSVIILKTKINFPDILKNISFYSKYLFVCDFYNEDYFYLRNLLSKQS